MTELTTGEVGISRRAMLVMASAGVVAAALPELAFAQSRAKSDVPVADLMKPGPLPDLAIGPAEAKVVIVEYASMTCGHCANFHNTVFPELKKKYIDTGKVRFVMREFPLDNLAAAASMLARCAGGDKTFPLVSALFKTQSQWAFVRSNPVPALFEIAKQAGFTKSSFDKCLSDQKLLENITSLRDRANSEFGVNSTPTFFVNGKRLNGSSMDDFDKAIEPLLKS